MSERVGSDIERLWNWIRTSTQNQLKIKSFKFRVVPCRIRFFPTLIFYKMALVWTTLNVFRLERIALFLNANCEANETQRKWYVTQVKHCLDRTSGLTLPPSIPNPNPTRAKPRRKLCAVHHYKRRVKYDKQGLQIKFLNKSTARFSSHVTCYDYT